ncbi:M48 family metalloprotease [Lysobacter sp. K5869]|uniref:M48 family metallopeptidase n=1 Tax=Lysobacter sp. K5869 TaxID=2820808 RepID=UPI001C061792|nr:M48 family metallopeptidase [Lysobacter sp. K5869]QWP79314.1 M48 family metalloprotease [Lysobacter sp. K5869]
MLGLLGFVAVYFTLLVWFGWTAWRLFAALVQGDGGNVIGNLITGACAAFLCVFMAKALIFKRRGAGGEDLELKPAEQPELFAFLHRLADEAGAPRPHRVFLSPRVNAGVFYDLSLLNLILPSKKNLEIGLGLVNVLNLGELKAVLAHEFGHFAQRTMAVGRWVYVAQQVAGHIIAKRDAFDDFLRGLSRVDFRIAWVGWVLSLVVWSIRSLVEMVFRLVVLAQRALSREMEYQADLVAASLTGSDALVHALHRLGAADDAWNRTLGFANREYANKRPVADLFAVQTRMIEHLRRVFADAEYGEPPQLPADGREQHRVFKSELAQPPQMWSTHPANSDRERNLKRSYIACEIDPRPALSLLRDAQALKERITREMIDSAEPLAPVPIAESLERVDRDFDDLALNRRFRGTYLGRSTVRDYDGPDELYYPVPADAALDAHLSGLYPAEHGDALERLRELEAERGTLEALRDGHLRAPGGVVRWRGDELPAKQLPKVIAQLDGELAPLREQVREHDRRCRSVHLAAARALGGPWEALLRGQLAVLHYADHSHADLQDANHLLVNTYEVVTADRRVSSDELNRLVASANQLHRTLETLYAHAAQVRLDRRIAEYLKADDWAGALGEFRLPPADRDNIQQWLGAIDTWVRGTVGPLAALRDAALEALLATEDEVARRRRGDTDDERPVDTMIAAAPAVGADAGLDAQTAVEPAAGAETADTRFAPPSADAPASAPKEYARLKPGSARKRQTKLGWWDRFQTADGLVPSISRVAAAGGIVGAVLFVGASVGVSQLTVLNGLALPMRVDVDGRTFDVAPLQNVTVDLADSARHHVIARTADGAVVEEFDSDGPGHASHYVYNIASAAPLVEWTAAYGGYSDVPENKLGAPRWTSSTADHVFEEPPKQISTKSGGGHRRVLQGFADLSPSDQLQLIDSAAEKNALIAAHARWDAGDSRHLAEWLSAASSQPDFAKLVEARLRRAPTEVMSLRAEQDAAQGKPAYAEVCARHRAASERKPDSADLRYVAVRCAPDAPARDRAFDEGHARWPEHGWFALASGYAANERGQWNQALPLLRQAAKMPQTNEWIEVDAARAQRAIMGEAALLPAADSEQLKTLMAIETGSVPRESPTWGYVALKSGDLAAALDALKTVPLQRPRMLRLVAASEGAPANAVAQALGQAGTGDDDPASAWPLAALAEREHHDNAARLREEALRTDPKEAAQIAAFFDAVRRGGAASAEQAERALGKVSPRSRGIAYATAVVMLGRDCPKVWRDGAKRLLFAAERPYFG